MRRRLFRHEQKNFIRLVSGGRVSAIPAADAASSEEYRAAALQMTPPVDNTLTGTLALTLAGKNLRTHFAVSADAVQLIVDDVYYRFTLPAFRGTVTAGASQTELRSEIPGRIVKILAKAGDTVAAGEGLVIQEAMKMEMTLKAQTAVKIREILVEPGAQVEGDAVLMRFEAAG
jgi:biotin carboxyl carrier protein